MVLIATGTGDKDSTEITDSLLEAARDAANSNVGSSTPNGDSNGVVGQGDAEDEDEKERDEDSDSDASGEHTKPTPVKNASRKAHWAISSQATGATSTKKYGFTVGPVVELLLSEPVTSVVWHYKGDYFASLAPDAGSASVSIHQVSHFSIEVGIFFIVSLIYFPCCSYRKVKRSFHLQNRLERCKRSVSTLRARFYSLRRSNM